MSELIERQAAIDALKNRWKKTRNYEGIGDDIAEECELYLKQVPSAQPEPQEGHWIKHETPDGGEQYECSRCGVLWEFNDGTPEDNEAYFCPKCGTKMTISTK